MRNLLVMICLSLCLPLTAQTKVIKKNAVKANNYGVTYLLPKTTLVINAEVSKITCKAGPYYQYAERYLGVKNAITEDKVYYELGKVSLANVGIPDPDLSYLIEFKAGTTAPYVCLTEDGLICSINAEYEPVESPLDLIKKNKPESEPATNASVLSEELLMAGSIARQAEVAARQIYRIRESRLNILTGEADNLPPDGQSMKLMIEKLEEDERALTNLFIGVSSRSTELYEVTVVPHENLNKEVLFRFSERLGIVDADDLGGSPVFMNLTTTERPPVPNEKEMEKKMKGMKGVIYTIPGKATVEILMNQKTLHKSDVQIAQFGVQESLAPVMFEDKKMPVKVYFHPETGAIKQIIQ